MVAALHRPWAPMPTYPRDLMGDDREKRRRGQEISTPPRIGRPHRFTGARADISFITTPLPQTNPPFYPPFEHDIWWPPWNPFASIIIRLAAANDQRDG